MFITIYNWTSDLRSALQRRPDDEAGASLVEYALLVALIALVCIVAVIFFGGSVSNSFSHTGSAVGAAN